jgi:single stranded DNA-binding protein
MSDINSVCISGRLIRDPVIRNNGKAAASFTVASNEHYRDQAGALQERTAFVFAKIFGGRAQTVQNRKKGDMVMVAGRLRTEGTGAQSQLVLMCDSAEFVRPALRSSSNNPDAAVGDINRDRLNQEMA